MSFLRHFSIREIRLSPLHHILENIDLTQLTMMEN